MTRTNNPIQDAENHAAYMDRLTSKLPVCSECGFHIQQEKVFKRNGECLCDRCIEESKEYVESED